MKGIVSSLLVLLLALLAGCESRPAAQNARAISTVAAPADSVALAAAMDSARLFTAGLAEARLAVLRQGTLPADTSAPFVPKPAEPKWRRQPARLPPGSTRSRRYVGTLGGQPVVLELTGEQESSQYSGEYGPLYFFGSYYFAWGGQRREVVSEGYRTSQPLVLVERVWPDESKNDGLYELPPTSTGIWQAVQRVGPVLTGTWTDKATRRTTHFELHEDYTGAVQYEKVEIRIKAKRSCRIPNYQSDGSYIDYTRQATWWGPHLLSPDTLRQAWHQLQCPNPQQIRRQLAILLAHTDCKGNVYGMEQSRRLNYNGNGLLCWTDVTAKTTTASMPGQLVEEHTYDLATGQEHRVADWLRPNKRRAVGQLAIAYYVAQNPGKGALEAALRWKEKLPTFLLSSDGIAFRASGDDTSGEWFITYHAPIVIPYAAVAPYVQPGTPLARLVAARARPGR